MDDQVFLRSTGLRPLWGRCPKSSNEVESERADFSPERANLRPERTGFSSERANFRPERADSRSKRAYIGPKRADFRPEKANFRPERAWGEEVTKERTVVSTKVPHVPQDFVPLGVAAQKPEG